MRYLHYVLADGTKVKTYPEAVASGQRYKELMEDVPKKPVQVSPKRAEMMKKFNTRELV